MGDEDVEEEEEEEEEEDAQFAQEEEGLSDLDSFGEARERVNLSRKRSAE